MNKEDFNKFYQEVITQAETELKESNKELPLVFDFEFDDSLNIQVTREEAVKKWVEVRGRTFFERLRDRKKKGVHDYLWYMAQRFAYEKANERTGVDLRQLAKDNGIPLDFLLWHMKKNQIKPIQLACDHNYEGYGSNAIWYDVCEECNMCGANGNNDLESDELWEKIEVWKAAQKAKKQNQSSNK